MNAINASDTSAGTVATAGHRAGASLELRGLRREFGTAVALDGLDLDVAPGELLALLGPSGCGKTTALRVLAGFERPDAGQVLLDGKDIVPVPANRRDTAMVFQSYSLFPHLNARDNVGFGLRMRGTGVAERRARAAELLELVGLPGHGDRYPHQLSGGQQQRVALARALALRPRLLLLDEPLSALDAQVRVTLREEIRRLQLELGITTVFVTHDQEEALSMADRVAVMRGGRLEQCATPTELYARPATAFVAGFIGAMNRIPGQAAADGTVEVLGVRLPVDGPAPAPGPVEALLRPESLEVTAQGDGPGRVLGSAFHGPTVRVRIALTDARGEVTDVKADVPTHAAGALVPGARVAVRPQPRPVLLAVPDGSA
ncbi:ABC transporter ATP-binding protein [Streptomyces sp. G-G2]|uniref:ABC transporter ATP-binding protein n=1 Tax=Streptomyces sp. G-G2 TaxID=3046201 RepID=UPI0024BA12C4|nr:ABC transporter ATP-binding protein [Streptomyces sp. G-G2]MDJ0379996.1 ABC transporter ATP-binding protein [Streptomyces sp. G-G2]